MKLVSIAEGKAKLSEYVEECRRDAVVLTKHGHPRAALVPLEDEDDLERFLLSRNPRFLALLASSAATPRLSVAEAAKLIGATAPAKDAGVRRGARPSAPKGAGRRRGPKPR